MDSKHALMEGASLITAVAIAAGAAAGAVSAASGSTSGAPGITKGLSRLGKAFGGGMVTGLAVVGGAAAILSLAAYRSLKLLDDYYLG